MYGGAGGPYGQADPGEFIDPGTPPDPIMGELMLLMGPGEDEKPPRD